MKIMERHVQNPKDEGVVLEYVELTREFEEIKDYIMERERVLQGYLEKEMVQIPVSDILYIEAVKNLVFAYTDQSVYEMKPKLYQLEETLHNCKFLRASKSVLLNISKIRSVRPALNGRLLASLDNGEEVMISRQYATNIKRFIMEEL